MSDQAALLRESRTLSVSTVAAEFARRLHRMLNGRRLAGTLRGLSDHYLRDVGLERPLRSDAWERAMAKDRLLEAGWRYSQRV